MKFLFVCLIFSIAANAQKDVSEIPFDINDNYHKIKITDYDRYLSQVDSAACELKSNIYIWRSYTAQNEGNYIEMESCLNALDELYKKCCYDTIPYMPWMDLNQRRINLYTQTGALDKAEYYCQANLQLLQETGYEESQYTTIFNLAYQALGDIAYQRGQYQEAIDHYNYTIEIENEMAEKQNRSSTIWSIYSRLSKSYNEMGLLEAAHSNNEITHKQYLKDYWVGDLEAYKIANFIYTIELDLLRGKVDRPQELIAAIKSTETREQKDLWQCQYFESEIERLKGNNDKAYKSLVALLDTSVTNYMSDDFYAKVALSLSKTVEANGDFENALKYIDKAQLRIENSTSQSPTFGYKLVKHKVELLYSHNRVCDAVRLIIEHVQELQASYYPHIQSEVHYNLMSRYNEILDQTITSIKNECPELIDFVPFIMESNKSISLINEASQYSRLNSSNDYKIKALTSQIEYLERAKLLFEDKYIENRIFELKDTLNNLLAKSAILSSDNRTEKASYDRDIYYLFLWEGNKKLYCYHEKDNFSKISSVSKDTLAALDLSLDLSVTLSQIKSNYKTLYQLLDLHSPSITKSKQLVISPHGYMENISFDCLVVNDDFLISELPITYTPSHLYFNNQQEITKEDLSYLFVQPEFPPSPDGYAYVRSSLYHLPYASEEIRQLQKQFSEGSVLKNQDATKENIFSTASSHDVIHFATHAKTYNERDNVLSFVAFTDTENDKESSRLYLNEIKTLPLDAEMVVLSACETGLGNEVSGEVTSLARSFMVAGAKSVISSLWNINDQSSAIIMSKFYSHLKKGDDKGQAMRQAKQDYLASVDPEFSHPYYWAAMKVQGNNAAIFSRTLAHYIRPLSICVAALVGIILLLFSKNRLESP